MFKYKRDYKILVGGYTHGLKQTKPKILESCKYNYLFSQSKERRDKYTPA